jgi:5-methylthioadenosine/S-adenosylhomocysteine deaminase
MAADLVLVDVDKPHLLPRHNLIANLVHSAKAADVTHVMVDGRWLYRGGEILTLDEAQIKAEAERGAFRLIGQDMRQVREYRG